MEDHSWAGLLGLEVGSGVAPACARHCCSQAQSTAEKGGRVESAPGQLKLSWRRKQICSKG